MGSQRQVKFEIPVLMCTISPQSAVLVAVGAAVDEHSTGRTAGHAAVRLAVRAAARHLLSHTQALGARVVARGDGGAGGQCDGEGVALGAVRVAGGGAR